MINNSFELEKQSPVDNLTKDELTQRINSKYVDDSSVAEEILTKVKWSLTIQKQKDEDAFWNKDSSLAKLSGNLKGVVAECISNEIQINAAETVFSSQEISSDSIKMISSQRFAGTSSNKKGDILSHLVKESFVEKPIKFLDELENDPRTFEQFKLERVLSSAKKVDPQEYSKLYKEYVSNLKQRLMDEYIKGYTWGEVKEKDGTVTPAGEFYSSTVIPDSLIINANDGLIGYVEVKAYTADELANLISLIRQREEQNGSTAPYIEGKASDFGKKYIGANKETYLMGVNLDAETNFVDILRGLKKGQPELGINNLVVLRFPDDIPDNLLKQYGEMIVDYGYHNIIIQKLPFSGPEIEVLSKDLVKKHQQKLNYQLLKNKNFSDRELGVLNEWVEN